ncbi:MAG: hypothetical protein ACRDLO_04325, partial [Solirubrobacterales bacterium]
IAVIQNGLNLLNVAEPYQDITVGTVFILAASTELARRVRLRRTVRRRERGPPSEARPAERPGKEASEASRQTQERSNT